MICGIGNDGKIAALIEFGPKVFAGRQRVKQPPVYLTGRVLHVHTILFNVAGGRLARSCHHCSMFHCSI